MGPVLREAASLATIALALTAAAGCGGDDEPEADDAKSRYVASATAICENLGEASGDLADESFDGGEAPVTPSRLRAFDRDSVALQREALAELRALEPPPGDEEEVAQVWDALERAIVELDALPPDDPGEVGGPAELALSEFGALASDYGLGSCAEGL